MDIFNVLNIEAGAEFGNHDFTKTDIEPLLITKLLKIENKDISKYISNIIKQVNYKKYAEYKSHVYDAFLSIFIDQQDTCLFDSLINGFVVSKKTKYFINYLEDIDVDILLRILDKIKKSTVINLDTKYNFMNIITKSDKLKPLLISKSIDGITYNNNINIISYYCVSNDCDFNENTYNETIYNYLKNDDIAIQFLSFVNDILEKHKICEQTSSMLNGTRTNIAPLSFLGSLWKHMLVLYNKIDSSKIFSYTTETQRREFVYDESDNLETKIYLQTLKVFKFIYNYMPQSQGYSESLLNLGDVLHVILGVNSNEIKLFISQIEKILYGEQINILLTNLIKKYVSDFHQINHDAIDTIIQYLFSIKTDERKKLPEYLHEYMYKLLMTDTDYCNSRYKTDIVKFMSNVYNVNDTHTNKQLFEALINYNCECDIFKIEKMHIAYKYYSITLILIKNMMPTDDYKIDPKIIFKFMHKILSNIFNSVELMNSVCSTIDFTKSKTELKKTYNNLVDNISTAISMSFLVLEFILRLFVKVTTVRSELISNMFTAIINATEYYDSNMHLSDFFDAHNARIIHNSLSLFCNLTHSTHFVNIMQESKDKIPILKKMVDNYLLSNKDAKDDINEYITMLENKLSSMPTNEVPDEFLDPLTYIVIREPVMIPNIDMIFDKSSIMSQLYVEKINPYTREFLDEKLLDEYNTYEIVQNKIKEFMEKYNNWKNKNL